jgi:hypothetical protein
MHPLVRSSGHHFCHRDLVVRRQEGSVRPIRHHPKLKIVLKVNSRLGTHRAVLRLFPMDRRAMLHRHDVRATSTSPHHSSSTSLQMNRSSSGDSER